MINVKILTGQTDTHIKWLTDNKGLHKEVIKPWNELVQAAKKNGFSLDIASGYRSFEKQRSIWDRKMSGQLPVNNLLGKPVNINLLTDKEKLEAIMLFSALPGASRHHWGTEIDFYSASLLTDNQTLQLEPWEYKYNGPFAELTSWLNHHAQDFGFYFPYNKYRGGVAEEPWHMSYAPMAVKFSQQLTLDTLASVLEQQELLGKHQVLTHLETLYQQYIINVAEYSIG